MKVKAVALLIAMTLWLSSAAEAAVRVLLYSPAPDVEFSFVASASEIRDLNSALLNFASEEKFSPYRNVPRAKGKAFFLGLIRADGVDIIAEQKGANASVKMSCFNVNPSASDFDQVTNRVATILRHRWPRLKVTHKPPLVR